MESISRPYLALLMTLAETGLLVLQALRRRVLPAVVGLDSLVTGFICGGFLSVTLTANLMTRAPTAAPSSTPTAAPSVANGSSNDSWFGFNDRYMSYVLGASNIRESGRQDARSAIGWVACGVSSGWTSPFVCEIARLPYALVTVLIRPIPFVDSLTRESPFLLLSSFENVLWAVLLIFALLSSFRRSLFPALTVLCLLVIAAFALGHGIA